MFASTVIYMKIFTIFVGKNRNPSQPTCRSIPAGLVRFLSSTALSRSARDRRVLFSSASPNMSSSPIPLPPLLLEPPVAISLRSGVVWLMLTLLSLAGNLPPVSVAESCARIVSTCQGGVRVSVVFIQARDHDTRSPKRSRAHVALSGLAMTRRVKYENYFRSTHVVGESSRGSPFRALEREAYHRTLGIVSIYGQCTM